VRRLLVVSDLAAIILGTAATLLLLPVFGRSLGADTLLPEAIVMLPAWVLIAFWFGLYHDFEARIDRSFVHDIGKVAVAVAIWNWLFIFLRALVVAGITELLPMAILWLMVVVLIMVGRSLVRRLARVLGWDRQQVALIGDEEGIGALADRFSRHPEWGMVVATEIAVEPETAAKWGGDGSGVGSWDRAAPTGPSSPGASPVSSISRPGPGWSRSWSNGDSRSTSSPVGPRTFTPGRPPRMSRASP
jgi:FlaA1/EpsC-like NDP-sugar epimerase